GGIFFFQAEDGIRDLIVTGVQTCALPISYVSTTATEGSFIFNSNGSTVDGRSKVDGLGRPIVQQRKQGPTASNYDSVETDFDVRSEEHTSETPVTIRSRMPSSA